ncbi:MAG TPA: hypothetical protein VHV08_06880 [Pirellulales bacterium]|nr:hypothetical protein [Pirellulales bacterium]
MAMDSIPQQKQITAIEPHTKPGLRNIIAMRTARIIQVATNTPRLEVSTTRAVPGQARRRITTMDEDSAIGHRVVESMLAGTVSPDLATLPAATTGTQVIMEPSIAARATTCITTISPDMDNGAQVTGHRTILPVGIITGRTPGDLRITVRIITGTPACRLVDAMVTMTRIA